MSNVIDLDMLLALPDIFESNANANILPVRAIRDSPAPLIAERWHKHKVVYLGIGIRRTSRTSHFEIALYVGLTRDAMYRCGFSSSAHLHCLHYAGQKARFFQQRLDQGDDITEAALELRSELESKKVLYFHCVVNGDGEALLHQAFGPADLTRKLKSGV
jgi:hypothetical protein